MNPCDKCLMPSKIKCCHNCKKDAAKCGNWHKCGEDCEKWEAPIQTNADRIRAMNDEELAEWLVKKTKYQESAWSEPSYLNFLTKSDDALKSAIKGTTEWLKQPAEVEG